MSVEIRERVFEEAIEMALLANGPGAGDLAGSAVAEAIVPYGGALPGGYRKRVPEEYNRSLCLIPRDVLDFLLATQPKEWETLKQHYGADVKQLFLARLSRSRFRRRAALEAGAGTDSPSFFSARRAPGSDPPPPAGTARAAPSVLTASARSGTSGRGRPINRSATPGCFRPRPFRNPVLAEGGPAGSD